LYDYLERGTVVIVTSEYGDMFVSLANGMTFVKSQGRWRYQNHQATESLLATKLPPSVATSAIRLALNCSFDRVGALFVFVDPESELRTIVPDHGQNEQVAGALRKTVKALTIENPYDRRLISAAARADGAIILNHDGRVLDAACMVSEPSSEMLARHGITELKRFSGARTTAAWNASISGLAIKVSEDGPIDVYSEGSQMAKMG
jgi:hypothetical protein